MSESMEHGQSVRVAVRPERRLIPAGDECTVYVLLDIEMPSVREQTQRPPLNLSLVIDRSGSMSGEKLEFVKEAATHALRLLHSGDRASVVVYDDEVNLIAPSQATASEVREEMVRQVRRIRTGGSTNLSGGWFSGCEQVHKYASPGYVNRVLLLTDGLANQGMTDHEELVSSGKEWRRHGVTTTTFGVGADYDQFLLQGIGDAGGGHYYFIGNAREIPGLFAQELGEMLSTVAREMTLEIGQWPGWRCETLNDLPTDDRNGHVRVLLGDASAGRRAGFALKLTGSAPAAGQEIALPVTLAYEDAASHRMITLPVSQLSFRAALAAEAAAEQPDAGVLQAAGQLEIDQTRMKTLRQARAGDVQGAMAYGRSALQGMQNAQFAPAAAPALEELNEVLHEMEAGMDEQKAKERHYESYRRQRSR